MFPTSRYSGAIPVSLVLLALLAAPAAATTIPLEALIDGAQAGTGSPGTGSATMTFDTDTNLFSWDISWSDLVGTETVMHFHGPAEPGVSAAVQLDFGSISGTTSPSIGSATITSNQAADLLAGLWYINIHSTVNPAGEIRGQVTQTQVPEPTALLLMSIASAGLLAPRRRADRRSQP